MDRYTNFHIDDFVQDDFFCRWVLAPNEEANRFWAHWLESYPHQQDTILQARMIVERLHLANEVAPTEQVLQDTWEQIEKVTHKQIHPSTKSIGPYFKWLAAAAMLVFITKFVIQFSNKLTSGLSPSPVAIEWMELKNNSTAVQRLVLDDGSTVALEPKSLLRYPSHFSGKTRPVILEGEAFFDIQRDSMLPFIVYANETVVRVLGTSFFVKTATDKDDVEVIVRTGKVAVYKKGELNKKGGRQNTSKIVPLLVTPNQKVVYEAATQRLSKRLTSTPTLVKPLAELPRLRFDDAPINKILDALTNAYGIDIQLANNAMVDCLLTTTLTEQTLFEKLDIICAPLGLRYYEQDAAIVIIGNCSIE